MKYPKTKTAYENLKERLVGSVIKTNLGETKKVIALEEYFDDDWNEFRYFVRYEDGDSNDLMDLD